jgi:hypothetical protein
VSVAVWRRCHLVCHWIQDPLLPKSCPCSTELGRTAHDTAIWRTVRSYGLRLACTTARCSCHCGQRLRRGLFAGHARGPRQDGGQLVAPAGHKLVAPAGHREGSGLASVRTALRPAVSAGTTTIRRLAGRRCWKVSREDPRAGRIFSQRPTVAAKRTL